MFPGTSLRNGRRWVASVRPIPTRYVINLFSHILQKRHVLNDLRYKRNALVSRKGDLRKEDRLNFNFISTKERLRPTCTFKLIFQGANSYPLHLLLLCVLFWTPTNSGAASEGDATATQAVVMYGSRRKATTISEHSSAWMTTSGNESGSGGVDSSKNLLFTKHLQRFVEFLLCPFLHLNANPLLVRNGTQIQNPSKIIIIIWKCGQRDSSCCLHPSPAGFCCCPIPATRRCKPSRAHCWSQNKRWRGGDLKNL